MVPLCPESRHPEMGPIYRRAVRRMPTDLECHVRVGVPGGAFLTEATPTDRVG
jgi:hypothetical protein